MFIFDICKVFEKNKIPYAVVGGYAVAMHGAIRGTVDIDIVIELTLKNFKKFEEAMITLGLKSKIPVDAETVFQFREEYIKNRNLIAWNFYDPSNATRQVDLIITFDLRNAKTKTMKTKFGNIRVLSLDDLIKMKKESGRPQDLQDVKALEEL